MRYYLLAILVGILLGILICFITGGCATYTTYTLKEGDRLVIDTNTNAVEYIPKKGSDQELINGQMFLFITQRRYER